MTIETTTFELSSLFISFLIIAAVMRINSYLDASGEELSSKKWSFFETLLALFFGVLGFYYILVYYWDELLEPMEKAHKKKLEKEKLGDGVIDV